MAEEIIKAIGKGDRLELGPEFSLKNRYFAKASKARDGDSYVEKMSRASVLAA